MSIIREIAKHRPGMGSWQLGSDGTWSAMSMQDGIQLAKAAFESGIRLYDTAPGYSRGMSETILGNALKGVRDQAFLISKFGHRADGSTDFSSASIEGAIKDSLRRLQTDRLDALLLHNPPFDILEGKTDHFDVLRNMKRSGLIRSFGVSCDTVAELKAAMNIDGLEVLEVLCNVFFQELTPLFPLAAEKGIAVIAKVPLDSGWLTGKYDATSVFDGVRSRWGRKDIVRRAALVEQLKAIAKSDDLTPLALGYLFSLPGLANVIPGIRSEIHLNKLLEASRFRPNHVQLQAIKELYERDIADHPLSW
jgi:aryl-alcohol dehydrogenase-like predicted oxidoreductase